MNIAIIEYKSDIEEALNYLHPRESIWLSVSGESTYYLLKQGIKFITEEDLLSPAEFKQIGDENFELTEMWVKEMEKRLHAQNPVFTDKHFYPFRWNFCRLKILLDAVRVRQILLNRLAEKEKPEIIVASKAADPSNIHDHNLFFYKNDSLYGFLAEQIAVKNNIKIKILSKPILTPYVKSYNMGISAVFGKLIRELNILVKYKDLFGRHKDNILVGTLVYDIEFIRYQLSKKFNFYYYINPLNIISLNYLLRSNPNPEYSKYPKVEFDKIFFDTTITGDFIVDDILRKRAQSYAEKSLGFLWNGLNYLEDNDDKRDFKCFIHSAGAYDSFSGLVISYFDRAKKPFIVIQHGGYGFALNRIAEYDEFGHNGSFFSWGEGVTRMYEGRKKGNCRIIPTGSYLIDTIRKNSKRRKNIRKVCYIPGTYRGYTAYYPNGQPCLDSKMFLMETGFLLALKPYLNKYCITYKASPPASRYSRVFGKNPMFDWIKENLRGIKIDCRPLSSIIHEFDLFVIDFPTTVLVQTAATFAEILVYVGNQYHSLSEENIKILEKRAVMGLSEDDFKEKIKSVLDKGKIISNVEDASFLEKYGTYLNDGKSLDRMVSGVLNVIK